MPSTDGHLHSRHSCRTSSSQKSRRPDPPLSVVPRLLPLVVALALLTPSAGRGQARLGPGTGVGQEVAGPDGGTFVWVPPGEFRMGVEADGEADDAMGDAPSHRVQIGEGFWLSRYEVSASQYARFLEAHGSNRDADGNELVRLGGPDTEILYGDGGYTAKAGREQRPVSQVTWFGAVAYCTHYGMRLPTEAEWEFAAVGQTGRAYPWGDEIEHHACCATVALGSGRPPTLDVGSLPGGVSWCGAMDMAGNVAEWCADWYDGDYYRTSPPANPAGPAAGTKRVLRGGAWISGPLQCESACRAMQRPEEPLAWSGFRPCVSPAPLRRPHAPSADADASHHAPRAGAEAGVDEAGPTGGQRSPPELVAQLGHPARDIIKDAVLSCDGFHVVTMGTGAAILWDVPTGRHIQSFTGHTGSCSCLALAPSSSFLLTGAHDGTARLWETFTGRQIGEFPGHVDWVGTVAFCPGEQRVITADARGNAWLWEVETGQRLLTFERDALPDRCVAFSGDGRLVLVEQARGEMRLLDAFSGDVIHRLVGHSGPLAYVAFSPGGEYVVSSGSDLTTRVWDVATGHEVRSLGPHPGPAVLSAVSSDGEAVVTLEFAEADAWGAGERVRRLWAVGTGREVKRWKQGGTPVAFPPTGGFLLCGTQLLSPSTGEVLRELSGSASGARLAVDGRAVLRWDHRAAWMQSTETGEDTRRFQGYGRPVNCVAYSPDGRFVATLGGGLAGLWDLRLATMDRRFSDRPSGWPTQGVSFSPDGRLLLKTSGMGPVVTIDMGTGEELRRFGSGPAAFSPDGRYILSAPAYGEEGLACLREATTGEVAQRFGSAMGRRVLSLAASPDGAAAAVATDKGALLFSVSTGTQMRRLSTGALDCWPTHIVFSPDGRSILGAGNDRTARVWDGHTGELAYELTGHTSAVSCGAFSPEGDNVATGGWDGTVRLWRTDDGTERQCLAQLGTWVNSVAFSPDGRHVLAGSSDGMARIWEVATGDELCRLAVLTRGETGLAESAEPEAAPYLMATPDGYYACSPGAENAVAFRVGREVFPADRFASDFSRPEVILRRLAGTSQD